MSKKHPPPVLHSARVVSYAFVDDIPYRQCGRLFVGDKLLEAVPRLAIVVNLGKDIGPMLVLAVLANVAYCAAYLVDVIAQLSSFRAQWLKCRWAVC